VSELPPNAPLSSSEQPSPETQQSTQWQEQLKNEQQKYVYLYAEFENYKKRVARERADLVKFGFENAARDLIQVADNLQRAIEHIPESTDKNLRTGIQMVLDQLTQTFQKHGVEPVTATSQSFDPNLHEAVGQQAAEAPAGTIVLEHQRGYTLHGRLLRPARVVVSSGPSSTETKSV
jgi:molecular chaperone GrpE